MAFNRSFSFNDDEAPRGSNVHNQLSRHGQAYRDHTSPPGGHSVNPPSPPPHQNPPSNFVPLTNKPNPHLPESLRSATNPRIEYVHNVGYGNQHIRHSTSICSASSITPGMDNLGTSAVGGGIAGIAMGVANTNERDSGLEALRSIPNSINNISSTSHDGSNSTGATGTSYISESIHGTRSLQQSHAYGSSSPYGPASGSSGDLAPYSNPFDDGMRMDSYTQERGFNSQPSYEDNPYKRYSSAWDPRVGQGDIDPNDIEDDGDDGVMDANPRQKSALSLGKHSDHISPQGDVATGAAAGGILGGLGGLVGRKSIGGRARSTPSGNYGPVNGQGFENSGMEKSEWLTRQTSGRKKLRWIVGSIMAVLIIGAVVGGVIAGIKAAKSNHNKTTTASGGSGESAAQDDGGADLDKDSPEIKQLLGNANLHKVFPGMDYTPFNAQYPACLTNPPSQNNVTRDMAVLSQLTNAVRLYGTDCNQTEMVLHAIDKLALTDMKIWLGVWLENNATTNNRQLSAMYDILDQNGAGPFKGVIVGNEVLFRKDLTEAELGIALSNVKSNLTAKNIDLPVATSDLGDDWTGALTADVDIVMSNVHPFFAGVTPDVAAGWTWNFWQEFDVLLTKGTPKQNIISEVGWPSAGGNDCGASNCTNPTMGSVAGIDDMNTFMDNFVCQSMANGTEYFW